jgi:hypothetical protein
MEIWGKQIQISASLYNRRKDFRHILALKGRLTDQHFVT